MILIKYELKLAKSKKLQKIAVKKKKKKKKRLFVDSKEIISTGASVSPR